MKRATILVLSIFIGMQCAWAQSSQVAFEKSLADSIKYVMPEFKSGRIVYKNGEYSNGAFNISTLDQSLRYIGENGEVLSLADNESVDRVIIGNMMFFRYNRMYVGVVDSIGEIMLCASNRLVFDDAKTGAYGSKSSTSNIKEVGKLSAERGMYFDVNNMSDYELKHTPYIHKGNKFYIPTKKFLLKTFPDKAAQIEKYIDENRPNLGKLEDMQQLFNAIK